MKFKVHQGSWLHGTGDLADRPPGAPVADFVKSCLYNKDLGSGCCLGHLLNDLGVEATHLEGQDYPISVKCGDPDLKRTWVEQHQAMLKIATMNDRADLPEAARKLALTEMFAEIGYEVEFVDGERDWR